MKAAILVKSPFSHNALFGFMIAAARSTAGEEVERTADMGILLGLGLRC
jgi:hypothetical protein